MNFLAKQLPAWATLAIFLLMSVVAATTFYVNTEANAAKIIENSERIDCLQDKNDEQQREITTILNSIDRRLYRIEIKMGEEDGN